jgi:hypothetical protein
MFNGNYPPWQDFLLNKMKIGRPTLEKSEKKGKVTGVRLRPGERAMLERAAAKREEALSTWIRNVLVNAADQELSSPIKTS